jgi:IMP dehydrogenase/GMP reductase
LENSGKVKQPKSLNYLLQLYRSQDVPDVPQMLAHFVEQEKTRSKKRMQEKLNSSMIEQTHDGGQLDDYLLNNNGDNSLLNNDAVDNSYLYSMRNKPLTKQQMHLEKVMRDIEKIKSSKVEAKDRKTLEEELKRVRDE